MAKASCIVCSSSEQNYLFTCHHGRVYRCAGCGLVSSSSNSVDESASSSPPASAPQTPLWAEPETEFKAAKNYISHLAEQGVTKGRVLLVCTMLDHPLAFALKEQGFFVTVREPDELSLLCGVDFDCVILLYCLEKNAEPLKLLEESGQALAPNGLLMLCTPALDSWSARFFQKSWTAWHRQNLFYFSRTTLQLLLEKAGYHSIWTEADVRSFSVEHILQRARAFPVTALTRAINAVASFMPDSIRNVALPVPSSGLIASCRPGNRREGRKLSIIMPVYNEKATLAKTLQAVLDKQIEGISEKEIVLVESNSSDGTRELVRSFTGAPGLRIIYEERPQGKGHAVRTGFEHARGDFILIQDADCEYDINDYDELLKPLLLRQSLFVLGSRHQGNWKMRSFTDRPHLAVLFNFGHLLFTWLMNVLYGQRMNDPFTMYKVFRRECLYGLNFECNRFDFDHELVIKLVLKGYTPLEIPVNYWSRSYSEGKKVTIVMDPLLWIRANFKFRFVSPFKPLAQLRADEATRVENFAPPAVPALTEQSVTGSAFQEIAGVPPPTFRRTNFASSAQTGELALPASNGDQPGVLNQ